MVAGKKGGWAACTTDTQGRRVDANFEWLQTVKSLHAIRCMEIKGAKAGPGRKGPKEDQTDIYLLIHKRWIFPQTPFPHPSFGSAPTTSLFIFCMYVYLLAVDQVSFWPCLILYHPPPPDTQIFFSNAARGGARALEFGQRTPTRKTNRVRAYGLSGAQVGGRAGGSQSGASEAERSRGRRSID